jgi:division protein CdvB (Snf7/Vps24/ESCRT-III family)
MSDFLSKIVIKTITKVVKNTSKFDIVVDDLIDKFKDSCPPKPELLRLVKQKNQIQSALTNLTNSINTLQTTGEVTNDLIGAVRTAVRVIKTIPVPTAIIPPGGGVGIPIRVITILADSLDALGKVLDGAKGAVKVIPTAIRVIQTSAQNVLTKLGQLDLVINKCIEELAAGLNQQERNELINEIGNAAALSGNFTDPIINTEEEDALLRRLSPNSGFPLLYRRFILTIESNSENTFSFPQRRVVGNRPFSSETRIPTPAERTAALPDLITNVVQNFPQTSLTNLADGGYSYSTSVKVLIDEIKFRIDQLETPNPLITLFPTISTNTAGNNDGEPLTNPYDPFFESGSVNNEIRFRESRPYKYNQSTDKWSPTTVELYPFNVPGNSNGERKWSPEYYSQGIYEWDMRLYKWRLL